MLLKPARVFFEKEALDYPMGKRIYNRFKNEGVPVQFLQSHNRVTGIPGKTPREAFFQGKNTVVVGIRHTLDFAGCKPSAHYQLPLVTGCQGVCEYCYLNTQLGKKPYTRIYVNIEEILGQAQKLIDQRDPEITFFEAAAASDPVPYESYSGALARTIDFFASQPNGRLRFVTKFCNVDSLLTLDHRQHTRIRFSINSDSVIKTYEHRTPPLSERLEALSKVVKHDYPGGVIIGPVILQPGWQNDYQTLLAAMREKVAPRHDRQIDFEIISHRFTRRARTTILETFPDTTLPMDETTDRQFKYGQFGYGKFVYSKEKLNEMKEFFTGKLGELFPDSQIDYVI